jgi:hypothetical protein
MDFFTSLGYATLSASLMILQFRLLPANNQTTFVSATKNVPQDKLYNSRKTNMLMTVKLLPYEILAGKATSYADVSLTLSNPCQQDKEISINNIEILTANLEQILMTSTPESLKVGKKIFLKSGESILLEYRLQSQSQIYQRGQEVIAQISYQLNSETEKILLSQPEAPAFMIP